MLDAVTDAPHDLGDCGPVGFNPLDCGCRGEPWHVARFVPGQERTARAELHRIGVSTFLPLVRETVRDKRLGQRARTVPAFPGCLFVRWRRGFDWSLVLSRAGVLAGPAGLIRPVGDRFGHPAAVPAAFMAELFGRAAEGGVIQDDTLPPPRRRKRRWANLADLAGPQRLDLLHRALGV